MQGELMHTNEYLPISSATGIVLCGGKSTRMRRLTKGLMPKHLLPISYTTTLLDNAVQNLKSAGLKKIILITSDDTSPHIMNHAKMNYDLYSGVEYFDHNGTTVGIAPTLSLLMRYRTFNGQIIQLDGDELNHKLDLKEMYKHHIKCGYAITYAVTKKTNPKYQMILDREGNPRIVNATKQDDNSFGLTGAHVFDPLIIKSMQDAGSTANFLAEVSERQSVGYFNFNGFSVNVNTPMDYINLIHYLNL